MYLNTVLTKVFAFVFGKFIVFVFVLKYYAMYLDPRLTYARARTHIPNTHTTHRVCVYVLHAFGYNQASSVFQYVTLKYSTDTYVQAVLLD